VASPAEKMSLPPTEEETQELSNLNQARNKFFAAREETAKLNRQLEALLTSQGVKKTVVRTRKTDQLMAEIDKIKGQLEQAKTKIKSAILTRLNP